MICLFWQQGISERMGNEHREGLDLAKRFEYSVLIDLVTFKRWDGVKDEKC